MKSMIFGALMLALGAVAQPLSSETSRADDERTAGHCGFNTMPKECKVGFTEFCICPSGKFEFHSMANAHC